MKREILAVDDSKAIRFLLQSILSKDYKVITMPDGHAAMYWLSRKNAPCLIIADPQLPGMHDWELVKKLSPGGDYGDCPLMVLSGMQDHETRSKCLEYGVTEYLLKPFSPSGLLDSINRMMRKNALDTDHFQAN